jgi:hypothetical protein
LNIEGKNATISQIVEWLVAFWIGTVIYHEIAPQWLPGLTPALLLSVRSSLDKATNTL